MADVLQATRFQTVMERDTWAMCPHGHSPDKGLRSPEVRKQHREARHPTHRLEGANDLTRSIASLRLPKVSSAAHSDSHVGLALDFCLTLGLHSRGPP